MPPPETETLRTGEYFTLGIGFSICVILTIVSVLLSILFEKLAKCDPTCDENGSEVKTDGTYTCGGAKMSLLYWDMMLEPYH